MNLLAQVVNHRRGNFEGRKVKIKASRYLQRIFKYSGVGVSCSIASLIYMERFKVHNPTLLLNSRSLQRLLLVPVMLASKYLEDTFYSNKCWLVKFSMSLQL